MDNHEYTIDTLMFFRHDRIDTIAEALAHDVAVRIEDRPAYRERFRKAIAVALEKELSEIGYK